MHLPFIPTMRTGCAAPASFIRFPPLSIKLSRTFSKKKQPPDEE